MNNYTVDLNSRNMLLNNLKLKLTEKEINTINYLFKSNKPVSIDELQEKDISILISYFNNISDQTGEENIKRIALSGFFLNSFYLCDDNPHTFYGKSVVDLTYNEGELFSYGRYFKSILSEMKNKPHPEIMEDPDNLIELYNVGKNSDKMKESMDNADATIVVGATNEDLERMGLKAPSDEPQTGVSLQAEADKKGGKLSMEDLMKLHS